MSVRPQLAAVDGREAQPEKQQHERLVTVGHAARTLGISAGEVVELCEAGTLWAQLARNRFWLIDEDSLARWREANPAKQPMQSPCPTGCCSAHWERRGQVVPEFRANLCRRCYSGRSLPVKSEADASLD